MTRPTALAALAALALTLPACGDEVPTTPDAAPGGCPTAAADRYLPLAVGATWTYDVTPLGGATVQKQTTVEALEDVGDRKAGTVAYRIRTEKTDGATVSWQEDRCTEVVRHRERSFDASATLTSDQFYVPAKPRVDETAAHTTVGATWSVTYAETEVTPSTGQETTKSKTETWTVEAEGEMVTVPAGTFSCLRVRKVGTGSGQSDKRFWFARGVGKIKEEGDQLEELVSYEPPASLRAGVQP